MKKVCMGVRERASERACPPHAPGRLNIRTLSLVTSHTHPPNSFPRHLNLAMLSPPSPPIPLSHTHPPNSSPRAHASHASHPFIRARTPTRQVLLSHPEGVRGALSHSRTLPRSHKHPSIPRLIRTRATTKRQVGRMTVSERDEMTRKRFRRMSV